MKFKTKQMAIKPNTMDIQDSHVVGPSDPENPPKLTTADHLKLAEMTRAMSEEEMMLVLENIPAELCVKRIELELKKARAFGNAIEKAMRILE
jgi:hypothetical protein